MYPSHVFDILAGLWHTYWFFAWPFLLVHLLVFFAVIRLWREIHSEAQSLRDWPQEQPSTGVCVEALQQFVEEAQKLGPRGILVPMTDFSDRLDSHVSGQIESLHSRVNLFLIVGVAGTFFAMYSFVGGENLLALDAKAISKRLNEGLAQALPVGFVGLALTFVFHFAAFYAENGFRKAVTQAAQRAMSKRSESAVGSLDKLDKALAPLEHLENTLALSLTPVIEGFREQLEKTSGLIEGQIQPLQTTIGSFKVAVEALQEPSKALLEAAKTMPQALQKVHEVQAESLKQLEKTATLVEKLSVDVRESAESLRNAATGLQTVPAEISKNFSEGLDQMTQAAVAANGQLASAYQNGVTNIQQASIKAWANLCDEVKAGFDPAATQIGNAARLLEESAQKLAELPDSVSKHVEASLSRLDEGMKHTMLDLSKDVHKTWKDTGDRFATETQTQVVGLFQEMSSATKNSTEQLGEASNSLGRFAQGAEATLKVSYNALHTHAVETLKPNLTLLKDGINEHLPAALKDLQKAAEESGRFCDGVSKLPNEMDLLLSSLKAAADRWQKLVEDAERIRQAPERQVDHRLLSVIGELRTSVERLNQALVRQPRRSIFEFFVKKPADS